MVPEKREVSNTSLTNNLRSGENLYLYGIDGLARWYTPLPNTHNCHSPQNHWPHEWQAKCVRQMRTSPGVSATLSPVILMTPKARPLKMVVTCSQGDIQRTTVEDDFVTYSQDDVRSNTSEDDARTCSQEPMRMAFFCLQHLPSQSPSARKMNIRACRVFSLDTYTI